MLNNDKSKYICTTTDNQYWQKYLKTVIASGVWSVSVCRQAGFILWAHLATTKHTKSNNKFELRSQQTDKTVKLSYV